MLSFINVIISRIFLVCIKLYQYTLSPDHGLASYYTVGVCRSRPTCSEFAYLEIKKRGIKAIPAVFIKIKNCQPF
ncbi:MAG: membrane protein insertion efficiency factor YidD [Candidatus Spechtbacteria bacterium]|nr:membrane protein insertion efficiency factor YidD [Candidatus Spechtbacteria bacterium]